MLALIILSTQWSPRKMIAVSTMNSLLDPLKGGRTPSTQVGNTMSIYMRDLAHQGKGRPMTIHASDRFSACANAGGTFLPAFEIDGPSRASMYQPYGRL